MCTHTPVMEQLPQAVHASIRSGRKIHELWFCPCILCAGENPLHEHACPAVYPPWTAMDAPGPGDPSPGASLSRIPAGTSPTPIIIPPILYPAFASSCQSPNVFPSVSVQMARNPNPGTAIFGKTRDPPSCFTFAEYSSIDGIPI